MPLKWLAVLKTPSLVAVLGSLLWLMVIFSGVVEMLPGGKLLVFLVSYCATCTLLVFNQARLEKIQVLIRSTCFVIASIFTYVVWGYLVELTPLNLLGGERGSLAAFISFLLPGLFTGILMFLILALPTSLLFGRASCLVPLLAMFMIMFVRNSYFEINDFTSKIILYENLCLGLFVSLNLYLFRQKIMGLV